MKCLNVSHTNRNFFIFFFVKSFWKKQMVTDNKWFRKNPHSPGVVFSVESSGASFHDLHEVWYRCWHTSSSIASGFFSLPLYPLTGQTPPFTLTSLPTDDPQRPPEQSYTPLISSIFHFSTVKKRAAAPTIGQNAAHSHCPACSRFHDLFSFIPLSTRRAEQCGAGEQGGGSWQDW